MANEIIIVSGLPRSGTSMMMQMLHQGGVEVLTDEIRSADVDNPRGYYEFERVKKLKEDRAWLPDARGKVVKMVSQLLLDLPPEESYRIIFMQRDLDEMLASQEKMLSRLGREAAPREDIKRAFVKHLERVHEWLDRQPNMKILRMPYDGLLADPGAAAARVSDFLGGGLNVDAMVAAVDPTLYRNRKDGKANASGQTTAG